MTLKVTKDFTFEMFFNTLIDEIEEKHVRATNSIR